MFNISNWVELLENLPISICIHLKLRLKCCCISGTIYANMFMKICYFNFIKILISNMSY